MNEVLKTRSQIQESTTWLAANDYINHPISAKDWELAMVFKNLKAACDLADLGADGSFVLHNAIKKGLKGRKAGIDLIEVTGTNKAEGAEYFQGSLTATPFEDNSFDVLTCLSVIEHQIDFYVFAKEVSRILRSGGELFLSFDYAPEKIDTSLTKLYDLDWNILSGEDVEHLIKCLEKEGLKLSSEVDWTTKDMVINPSYCSPVQGVSYTFSFLHFIKD